MSPSSSSGCPLHRDRNASGVGIVVDGDSGRNEKAYSGLGRHPPVSNRIETPERAAAYSIPGLTISNAWRCRAFSSSSAWTNSQFGQHLWWAQDTRRRPIHWPPLGNEFALCSSVG